MIRVHNLSYTYPGAKRATIQACSFHIAAGEIFGFLGPSGAGKTTSQKILIGLLKDYRGSAAIAGKEIAGEGRGLYERIGVAFEFPNLFSKFTGRENLQFFASLYPGTTKDPLVLLDSVGLRPEADKRVSAYSKGMRMRLNFCRALLHDPEILFLDEPTSGLDPGNAKLVRNLILDQQKQGRTIFLTTHNMTVADELCDRVAFLVDGTIKACEEPRKLKIQHGRRIVQVEYRAGKTLQRREYPLEQIGGNQDFFELLSHHEIETIHSKEATLEDVFIHTTGRGLQ